MKWDRRTWWRSTAWPPSRRGTATRSPCCNRRRGSSRCASARTGRFPPGAKSLAVTLPQPQASAPASAIIAVLPADNVELIPDNKAMVGLVRQQVAAPLELPPRQQEPLFYRNEASQAVFAAELRRHAQRISVDVGQPASCWRSKAAGWSRSWPTWFPTSRSIISCWRFPASLAGSGRLELFQQDQPVAAVALAGKRRRPGGAGADEDCPAEGVHRAVPVDGPLPAGPAKAGGRRSHAAERAAADARRRRTGRQQAVRQRGGGTPRGSPPRAVDGGGSGGRVAGGRAAAACN